MISFGKVGTSALQSRATGGVAGGTYLFALPGSPSACRDGWDEILKWQLDNRHRPCNLVELMPAPAGAPDDEAEGDGLADREQMRVEPVDDVEFRRRDPREQFRMFGIERGDRRVVERGAHAPARAHAPAPAFGREADGCVEPEHAAQVQPAPCGPVGTGGTLPAQSPPRQAG